MLYNELCNLDNPAEAELLIDVAGKSLQNSEWTLQGGLRSSHFFDIDNFIAGKNKTLSKLSEIIASKIKLLNTEICRFDKVAFIERSESGPVGIISLMVSVSQLIDEETLIVRPKKWLLKSSIKGEINKGDSVLIVCDVATTGETIFRAAEKLQAFGGRTHCALVVIDRAQGAIENLIRKGIKLYSLTSAKSLNEKSGDTIKQRFNRAIHPDYDPLLKDFGGMSKTSLA